MEKTSKNSKKGNIFCQFAFKLLTDVLVLLIFTFAVILIAEGVMPGFFSAYPLNLSSLAVFLLLVFLALNWTARRIFASSEEENLSPGKTADISDISCDSFLKTFLKAKNFIPSKILLFFVFLLAANASFKFGFPTALLLGFLLALIAFYFYQILNYRKN